MVAAYIAMQADFLKVVGVDRGQKIGFKADLHQEIIVVQAGTASAAPVQARGDALDLNLQLATSARDSDLRIAADMAKGTLGQAFEGGAHVGGGIRSHDILAGVAAEISPLGFLFLAGGKA